METTRPGCRGVVSLSFIHLLVSRQMTTCSAARSCLLDRHLNASEFSFGISILDEPYLVEKTGSDLQKAGELKHERLEDDHVCDDM